MQTEIDTTMTCMSCYLVSIEPSIPRMAQRQVHRNNALAAKPKDWLWSPQFQLERRARWWNLSSCLRWRLYRHSKLYSRTEATWGRLRYTPSASWTGSRCGDSGTCCRGVPELDLLCWFWQQSCCQESRQWRLWLWQWRAELPGGISELVQYDLQVIYFVGHERTIISEEHFSNETEDRLCSSGQPAHIEDGAVVPIADVHPFL